MKRKPLDIICILLIFATAAILIWGLAFQRPKRNHSNYSDGIEQIDPKNIKLRNSGVEVHFSDVILSKQEEQRKLVVSTQDAEVSIEITDKIFDQLDFKFLKKSQSIGYKAKGYFVVDLDKLTSSSIIQDDKKKVVTIKINPAYLEAIMIDPDLITVDDVKEGFFARGDVKLTLKDYQLLESMIKKQMEEQLNTYDNRKKADANALDAVKKVYEPIVKAIDSRYQLVVEEK